MPFLLGIHLVYLLSLPLQINELLCFFRSSWQVVSFNSDLSLVNKTLAHTLGKYFLKFLARKNCKSNIMNIWLGNTCYLNVSIATHLSILRVNLENFNILTLSKTSTLKSFCEYLYHSSFWGKNFMKIFSFFKNLKMSDHTHHSNVHGVLGMKEWEHLRKKN